VLIVGLSFLMPVSPASAGFTHNYVESFSTTQYMDPANTTAWWDTVRGELGLLTFDPVHVGNYGMSGGTYDLVVEGDHAFVIDNGYGLRVLDITDPANPTLAANLPILAARTIAVSGNRAYVAGLNSVLSVIDITDPWLSLLGSCSIFGPAYDIVVDGDHAFIAAATAGLQIVDIQVPTAPAAVGGISTGASVFAVDVTGDLAYVVDSAGGLLIVNVADPANPVPRGYWSSGVATVGIAVDGDRAFLAADTAGLIVIDVSNPDAPSYLGYWSPMNRIRDVYVSGDFAYVADGASGIQMIDISVPGAPQWVEGIDTPDDAYAVVVSGSHAFVSDRLSGMRVLEVRVPIEPLPVGSCATQSTARRITVEGDYAFVGAGTAGLQTIAAHQPWNPGAYPAADTPGDSRGVVVAGNYAYVADWGSGLQIADVTDPTSPSIVADFDTPGSAWDVKVAGNYAYVADGSGSSGLEVIDITNPLVPVFAGSYVTYALGVTLSGDYAYVANGSSGLLVIDINNPVSPAYAGICDTPGSAYNSAISGDFAYVADSESGLQVVDISNPGIPTIVGSCPTPASARDVVVEGDRAYVACWDSGVSVVDITDPANPVLENSYDTNGYTTGIDVAGDFVWVANGLANVQVLQVYQHYFTNPQGNAGWSLPVDESDEEIIRARLRSTQTDTVLWDISADGGAHWQAIEPVSAWAPLVYPGNDLLWRSTHRFGWLQPGVNPVCTNVELDWLYDFAPIDSIVDVPNDQGAWVRIHFTRSGRDFADEATYPVAAYDIHRRVDDALLREAVLAEATDWVELRGRVYRVFSSSPEKDLPEGVWEVVGTVHARQEEDYVALAPTLADSSASPTYSVYLVTTHTTTPSVWFTSPPDSGMSVDNLEPAAPLGLAAVSSGPDVELEWLASPEEDLNFYSVYRGDHSGFEIDTPIGYSTTPQYTDNLPGPGPHWYKVTASDFAENESAPSLPASPGMTGVADVSPAIPPELSLGPALPNPFNPATEICFAIPAGEPTSRVTLDVFDSLGRRVRTLVDDDFTPGRHSVLWDGTDHQGRSVASGVYFCRMICTREQRMLRLVLLK
jgi:hypothetical protein